MSAYDVSFEDVAEPDSVSFEVELDVVPSAFVDDESVLLDVEFDPVDPSVEFVDPETDPSTDSVVELVEPD